ncbi:hypothetical protein CJU35_05495 [Pseudomonas aeruginosa]|uniref:hypothetical protein n=1 Tax=Pseudomonas aeruginosa TaxID=287 RepID=UPI000BB9ACCE|nr:hypothetical protein [Pseudomonas aeruginosa]PBV09307.1 hypothetical protein CJU35_05495 [Pseudomonas aeruginosa]
MPMLLPWSDHEQADGSIEVRCDGTPKFSMVRPDGAGVWELRRVGEEEVFERDQYRNDLFCAIQSGRIK